MKKINNNNKISTSIITGFVDIDIDLHDNATIYIQTNL